jgi:hypothetical protein
MTDDEKNLLIEFMHHLNKRGLAVCNYSRVTSGYWPVNVENVTLIEAFAEGR